MKRQLRFKLILFLLGATLSLLISLNPVFSLGVAPSSYSVDLAEANQQYKIRIINSEGTDRILQITAKGALADYVTLSETVFGVSSNEATKTIYYTLNLPDDLPPGPQRLDIVISELPDQDSQNGAFLGASLQVSQKLVVNVPYPGIYLTGDLFVNGNQVNVPLTFTAHVVNRGQEFSSVSGQVRILSPLNEELGVVLLPQTTIGGVSDKKLVATFAGLPNPGMYTAQGLIYYNGQTLPLERNFAIGNLLVTATGINVKDFDLGDIAKLTIALENKWNQQVNDVYADLTMYTSDGRVISTFTTSPTTLSPYQRGSLDAFWDTDGIPIGEYTIRVNLYYAGQSSEHIFDAAVGVSGIDITKQSLGGQVIAGGATEEDKDNSLVMLFILLIVVVIVINLVWLGVVKKMMSKKK